MKRPASARLRALASERKLLGAVLLTRTNLNLPIRLTYFFLPVLGRGLHVSLVTASALVSVRSLASVSAPLFGLFSDRWGGNRVMLLGTVLLVLGAGLTAALPWFAAALVGFGLMGLAKSAYDPAMQAYLGQRVPYRQRARALGLAELAWSGALLGMPLYGWLIDRVGWRAPFAVIAGLGVVAWWVTLRNLTGDDPTPAPPAHTLRGLLHTLRALVGDPHTRLALVISALLSLAQDNLMVVYGAWMEDRFGLTVTTLGMVTLIFGAAEMAAELGVALLSDRLGKRRALLISVGAMGGAYLTLPRLSGSLGHALAGSAFVILTFEFSIVGILPIISGLNATARSTLMSLNVVATSLGRVLAAPLAVTLYRHGDIQRNGPVSAAACLVILLLLIRLHERDH